MKKYRSVKIIIMIFAVMSLINITSSSQYNREIIQKVNEVSLNVALKPSSPVYVIPAHTTDEKIIIYDGMSIEELAKKLDKNLNSTLKGYGETFANLAIKYDVDPYVATSIVLLETGCKWNCSSMVKKCNNIGGMKGAGHCNGSAYAKFSSLDKGIEAFFKNLSDNYYKKGLNTPELINKKYAENKDWHKKVNIYVEQIKSS